MLLIRPMAQPEPDSTAPAAGSSVWTTARDFLRQRPYLVTGIVMERWGNRLRNPRLLYVGYLLGTVIWAGYTLTHSIWVAIALSACDGLIFTFATTLFDTQVQEEAPAAERGRIYAVMRAGDQAATITGEVAGGALGRLYELRRQTYRTRPGSGLNR